MALYAPVVRCQQAVSHLSKRNRKVPPLYTQNMGRTDEPESRLTDGSLAL